PNKATTSEVGQKDERVAADNDGEETESDDDFADKHIETDDEDSDSGWHGKQESHDEDDSGDHSRKLDTVEVARSACPPTFAATGTINDDGVPSMKTEVGALPC
ncbi:unnamed protein product, partial [Pylaiella littoralis]